jgi:hypothetical protein
MTASNAAAPVIGQRPALHMATVVAPQYLKISFGELFHAIKQLVPSAKIGAWNHPELSAPPEADPGVEMIMVDGQRLAIFSIDRPLPTEFFQNGPLPNIFMRDPVAACSGQRSYIDIRRTAAPKSRVEALALSRAVTLVARAVAAVVSGLAIKWVDADHIVPPQVIDQDLAKLAQPAGTAPHLWSRLLITAGPPTSRGTNTLIVGTVGLHAFGLRDLEYAPSEQPAERLLAHAAAVSEYLLQPDVELKDGETLGTPGHDRFQISLMPRGLFLSTSIYRLTPSE